MRSKTLSIEFSSNTHHRAKRQLWKLRAWVSEIDFSVNRSVTQSFARTRNRLSLIELIYVSVTPFFPLNIIKYWNSNRVRQIGCAEAQYPEENIGKKEQSNRVIRKSYTHWRMERQQSLQQCMRSCASLNGSALPRTGQLIVVLPPEMGGVDEPCLHTLPRSFTQTNPNPNTITQIWKRNAKKCWLSFDIMLKQIMWRKILYFLNEYYLCISHLFIQVLYPNKETKVDRV